MKYNLKLAILISLAIFSFAFQWPWEVTQQTAKNKNASPQISAKASAKPAKQTPKTDKSPKSSPRQQVGGQETGGVDGDATAESYSGGASKGGLAVEPVESSVAEVAQIQERINNIIKVNDSLKSRYTEQAKDIEAISTQAKVHQKLLTELKTPPTSVAAYPAKDAAEMLRQEKIRLIQDQTQRNQDFLETLKRTERIRQ